MRRFASIAPLRMVQETRNILEEVLWSWAPEGLSQRFIESCQKAYDLLQSAILDDVALPELYDSQDVLIDSVVFKAFVDEEDTELQEWLDDELQPWIDDELQPWLDEWRNRYLDAVFKLMAYALKA